MVRHYAIPVLLIEFDEGKPFQFNASRDLPQEIRPTHIISKLVLLNTHFPALHFMWSRSPYMTVKLFAALKVCRIMALAAIHDNRMPPPRTVVLVQSLTRATSYPCAVVPRFRTEFCVLGLPEPQR